MVGPSALSLSGDHGQLDLAETLSQDLTIRIPTPADLKLELERLLSDLVEAARTTASERSAMLSRQSSAGQMLTYAKAALSGVGDFVVDTLNIIGSLCEFQLKLSPVTALVDITKGQWPGTTAKQAIEEAANAAENAAAAGYEAFRVVNALRQDPETWAIVERFVGQYATATHPLVLTEAGGELGTHMIFSLAMGGAAVPLSATRLAVKVNKLTELLTKIVNTQSKLDVQGAIREQLARVVQSLAQRYLSLPMVKATIKENQRQPLAAAGLWVPVLRQVPFFGLSQYVERKLNPGVANVLAMIGAEAIAALGPERAHQHGKCAEPLAIGRALTFCDRQGWNRSAASKALEGAYILAIRIDLAGNAYPADSSRRKRGRGLSYDRADPNVYPNPTKFGQSRRACASCDLLLRRFKIFDLGSDSLT